MRDFLIVVLVLSVLPAIALGHDIYIAYNNSELPPSEAFHLSDVGWLLIKYGPEHYNWALANIDATLWNNVVDPFFRVSTLYITSVPLVLYVFVMFVLKLFGLGSFEGEGLLTGSGKIKKKGYLSSKDKDSNKKTKYKRK